MGIPTGWELIVLLGVLVLLFGGPSFLFPVMIGFAGWLLYQDRSKEDAPSRATLAFRTVGFVFTLVTSCVPAPAASRSRARRSASIAPSMFFVWLASSSFASNTRA